MQHQNKKYNQFLANRKTAFQFVFFLLIISGLFAFSANVSQGAGNDSYTKLLLHGDGTGNSFTDSSSGNKSITANDDATQSSAQSKFGGKSMYFDGNGDYLTTPATSDFSLGSGDFTVDAWVYPTSSINQSSTDIRTIISAGNNFVDDNSGWFLGYGHTSSWGTGTRICFVSVNGKVWDSQSAVSNAVEINANTWYHIASVKKSETVTYYINGQEISSYSTSSDFQVSGGGPVSIGSEYLSSVYQRSHVGYIDELRISKGIARWTSNFTPPTSAYTEDLQPKTLTDPTPEDIESDITSGYLTVSGTNTEATSATINANYTLQTGSYQYTIPSNTTLTPSSGTMDITSLTVSDITNTINQQNSNSKAAIKIGIPNKQITFSQDITVTMSVGSAYNGKTLTIYSRPDNGETWTEETTCLVTDNQCSFTTDHATEYTANYEVSNSPTPTDVNVGIDPTISLTCSDSITLGTITGTGQSNLTTNEVTCTVGTINSSGYQLSWLASTAYMENENGDQISAYTPQTPTTPETWSVASTESAWGGRIKSTSTDPDITGSEIWDSSDSYSGTWLNIATSPFVVANRTTETAQEGSTETILFGAEIGSNKFQPTGTYDVDVTFTATTL